jgi:hypothetical protein
MGNVIAAGIVLLLARQTPADPFTAQRDAAALLNPLSPRFTVTVVGDRRTFRVGERISLVFSYDDVPNRRSNGEGPCRHYAAPVLDRTAGTHDPLRDFYRSGLAVAHGVCGCVEGGVPGTGTVLAVEYDVNGVPSLTTKPAPPAPPKPKPPMVKVPYELTEHVRFDVPGRYRFYMADGYEARPIISNIIELTIAPRDLAWEKETLRRVVGVLDGSPSPEERTEAMRTLNLLPSRAALDEMARRGASALFGARDRDGAIAAVSKYVDDPSSHASEYTVRNLAALHGTRLSSRWVVPANIRYRTLLQAHRRRWLALAKAGTLIDGIGKAFDADVRKKATGEPPKNSPQQITHALAAFPAEVETALTRVSVEPREYLLTLHRRVFGADVRFAPMLERLAVGGSHAALLALHDAAPARAHRIIFRDLAATAPRLPIAVAKELADETLPSLNTAFLRQLEAAREQAEFAGAMDRIERFGTRTIAARVREAYRARHDRGDCSIAIPALAFFLRTDPAFAIAEFDVVRRALPAEGENCRTEWRADLLFFIAKRRSQPALEMLASGLFAGEDAEAAVSAAEMLATHGSPGAKALISRALASWQSRWSADDVRALEQADPATWESVLEERLVGVLTRGKGWTLESGEMARLTAACRTSGCRIALDQPEETRTREPTISRGIDLDLSGRSGMYVIRGLFVTLRDLPGQLRFLPRGTTFQWREAIPRDPVWDLEQDADYLRVERIVRRAGMSLTER